jgi:hypothetical protein
MSLAASAGLTAAGAMVGGDAFADFGYAEDE